MAITIPSIDTSVADLALSRRRVWKQTGSRNRAGVPVVEDTGIDLVQYDGFPEGVEYGSSNFELRTDGTRTNRKYTGIVVLNESDPFFVLGPQTRGAAL